MCTAHILIVLGPSTGMWTPLLLPQKPPTVNSPLVSSWGCPASTRSVVEYWLPWSGAGLVQGATAAVSSSAGSPIMSRGHCLPPPPRWSLSPGMVTLYLKKKKKKCHVVNIEQKAKTEKQNKNRCNGQEKQINSVFMVTEARFPTVETRLERKSWTVVFWTQQTAGLINTYRNN